MSVRLDTLGDGDAWVTAGLVVPDFVPTGWTDIDFTDIFAGAGGSSIGLVSAEQVAERRGEELVWQTLLHEASAQLGNLAGYPHDRLCRAALDVAAEHIRAAEKVLRALDGVLDPKQSNYGRDLSTQHLHQRVEREQQALRQAR